MAAVPVHTAPAARRSFCTVGVTEADLRLFRRLTNPKHASERLSAAARDGGKPLFAPLSERDLKGLRAAQNDASLLPSALHTLLRRHHTRVLDLFQSWDVDASGSISRDELRRALSSLGIEATRGDVDDFLGGVAEPSDDGTAPKAISFRALQRALLRAEPRERVSSKVRARDMQLQKEQKHANREAALQALLQHEQAERARAEERSRGLEEELFAAQSELRTLRAELQRRDAERTRRADKTSAAGAASLSSACSSRAGAAGGASSTTRTVAEARATARANVERSKPQEVEIS